MSCCQLSYFQLKYTYDFIFIENENVTRKGAFHIELNQSRKKGGVVEEFHRKLTILIN